MTEIVFDNAALLVVDMQQDFISGSLPVPKAEAIIPTVNFWIEIFEDLEQPIVYSMDWHPHTTPHFDRWPVHCVAGTSGAQIDPRVIYEPISMSRVYTVAKGLGTDDGYSACSWPSKVFTATGEGGASNLDLVLKMEGIDTVVVVGLATDFCVRASVLDLLKLGYTVVVVLDATEGVSYEGRTDAVIHMAAAGARFIEGEEFLPELDSLGDVAV